MIQTKTFPNESPPEPNESWILVRQLRFRTVYMRKLAGTPRPIITEVPADLRSKTQRFSNEEEANIFIENISKAEEVDLEGMLKGLII